MSVNEEESPEVFIGGVRLFESGRLDHKPADSELTTDIGRLWTLIGKLEDKIKQIEIFHNDPFAATKCGCRAILVTGKDDVPEKLKQPCVCRGSEGIITFQSLSAARSFRKKLYEHKELHPQGLTDLKNNQDGSVELCNICCFNNKQLRSIRNRPRPEEKISDDKGEESSSDVKTDDETEAQGEAVITENQVRAIGMILHTSLEAGLCDEANVIKDAVRGKILNYVKKLITTKVNSVFNDLSKMHLFPERSPDNVKKTINSAVSKLVLNSTDEACVGKVFKWVKKFKTSTIDEVVEAEDDDEEVVRKQPPRVAENGETTDRSEDVHAIVSVAADEPVDATETGMRTLFTEIANTLLVCDNLELVGTTAIGEQTLKSLNQKNVKMTTTFLQLSHEDQEKVKTEYLENNKKVNQAIKFLIGKISVFRKENGMISKEPEKSKSDKRAVNPADVPTKIEVTGQINKFDAAYNTYVNLMDEINDIINDEQIERKRAQFNVIYDRIVPSVENCRKQMKTIAQEFIEWLRVPDMFTSSVKSKLEERAEKEATAYQEWMKLESEVSKIDKTYGFSSQNCGGGGAKLVSETKIKKFYGEEPGHEWQDLYEWLADVERALQSVHDNSSRVYYTIRLLSPNIARFANLKKFRNFKELKNWLIKNYVNDTKILRKWLNGIRSVKPTKFKDIGWYLTHVRGTLKRIQQYCYGKSTLQRRWMNEKNIYTLVKFILDQISVATKRKEYERFTIEVWSKVEEAAEESGVNPTPEEHLEKMDEFLEDVKRYAKTRSLMTDRIEHEELAGVTVTPRNRHEPEESDDNNSKEESWDEDENGSEKEDTEMEEKFIAKCIGCHGHFERSCLATSNDELFCEYCKR